MPGGSGHDKEVALLSDWFEKNVPVGSTLRWGDNHANIGPEHVHTGWIDVQIPAIERDLHWSWVWTVVGVDDDDGDLNDTCIRVASDVTVWQGWDPEARWWDDSFFVFTEPDAELPESSLALFEILPNPRPGWTVTAVIAALSRWCTTFIGRSDVTFEFDDAILSGDVEVVAQILESIESGDSETYEMAPGIRASSAVMDFLLELDVEEAAGISNAIVEQLSRVREMYSGHLEGNDDALVARWGEGPGSEEVREWECEVCEKHLIASANEAHELGWDTPPYFHGYIKCDECPIDKTAIWAMWTSGYGPDGT